MTTGWKDIDDITKGGLVKVNLVLLWLLLGLVNLWFWCTGCSGPHPGKNVLHYTLELADTVVANRYDSAITGVELKNLAFKRKYMMKSKKLKVD